ncbi:MAG: hypothetical protein KJO65_01425 [Gemmatimonadetes bacterium]|nr:hypothetical protein [Gemmatimonadota bacterium]
MILKAFSSLIALGVISACSSVGAPIADGSFVTYEIDGTRIQITFEAASGGEFRTVGRVTEEDGLGESAEGMPGHGETVNSKMRTASGSPLEVASFGPIWAPPGDLEEGGRVYGSSVSEVRAEQGRHVAVVKASVGVGGALQGEWLYDAATGFLVGGAMGTAFSGRDGGQRFRLVATNVSGLVVP